MNRKVVQYNFLGIEGELYSLDHAIVLSSDNNSLKLLPFTNDFKPESDTTICLGKISNFLNVDNDTFVESNCSVLLDKIIEVPKNKVRLIYKQDLDGSIIKDKNGDLVPVEINCEQYEYLSAKSNLFYA